MRHFLSAVAVLTFFYADSAQAVLFYDTGISTHNTSAPGGDYADSGWQYEGYFGGYLGTMISPNCFITAAHVGTSPTQFISKAVFNGGSDIVYTIDASANDAAGYWNITGTDLRIFKINETFSSHASLYTGSDEIGKELVVAGRGGVRGAEVYLNSTLKGWKTGSGDGVPRWGRNTVTDTTTSPSVGEVLAIDFNAIAGIDEAHLSKGDSGGGLFIQEDGIWKLAGINYLVDGHWDKDEDHSIGVFSAALFDKGGFWVGGGDVWEYTQDRPYDFPSSFYPSRISAYLAEITAITSEVRPVFWTGTGGTTWSTATGLNNWKDSGGAAVDYINGNLVTFDDTATGLTADISVADATPGSVLFNNSTKDFTVTGVHGITGNTGLTKQGAGKATLTSVNTYTGLTTVEAGTLELGLMAQSPVLIGGGADIQGGEIVFDYTGGSSPAVAVKTALTASYATGFASGQIYSSTATSAIGLGWVDDTGASELTVAYALYGDTNLDGSVDFTDLSNLLAGYDQPGDWAQGDFDYTGSVAFADLSKMLANYDESLPLMIDVSSYTLDASAIQALSHAGITTVPEPATIGLLVSVLLACLLGSAGKRLFGSRRA